MSKNFAGQHLGVVNAIMCGMIPLIVFVRAVITQIYTNYETSRLTRYSNNAGYYYACI